MGIYHYMLSSLWYTFDIFIMCKAKHLPCIDCRLHPPGTAKMATTISVAISLNESFSPWKFRWIHQSFVKFVTGIIIKNIILSKSSSKKGTILSMLLIIISVPKTVHTSMMVKIEDIVWQWKQLLINIPSLSFIAIW